jgi:hypothetical protein
MDGATSPLQHMSSRHAKGHLHFTQTLISPIFQCSGRLSFIVPWSNTGTLNFHINHLAYSLSDGNSANSLLASITFGILQAKLNILDYTA